MAQLTALPLTMVRTTMPASTQTRTTEPRMLLITHHTPLTNTEALLLIATKTTTLCTRQMSTTRPTTMPLTPSTAMAPTTLSTELLMDTLRMLPPNITLMDIMLMVDTDTDMDTD